jgi:diguanylate cyclase (GGDEF)-like protein
VLSRILDQLEHVVPFDSACVFLWQGDFVIAKAIKGIPNPAEVIEERFPADNALFQLILSTGNPVILADVQGDPRFEGWGGTQQMRGWMGVPLKTRGNIIGYLTLDNLRPGTYDTTMANLAQMFASQAAIALENATLYQTMKDSASRMVVLHRVSQEVVSAGADPERIYLAVHKAAALLMPCEAFVIAILDRKRDMIQAVYMIDRDGRSPSMWIPKDQGLSGHVISSGKAILEHDYLFSDDLREMRAIHFGSKDEVRAVLAVPMRLGKDVFGMLSAQSYDPGVYSPEDQSLLEMLAAYATIALENARLFREIQRLATIDGLTDTYNRRHFFELAEREIARSQRYKRPLSIIMLDIDYYKNINDTYGHAVGDEALREIAANLEKNLRESDVLGRYGGDEFSILLPETTLEQAIESAERLRKYIEKRPIVVNEMILHTSISLGVTSIDPQQTATAHENNNIILSDLLLCADMALYEAKSAGRNNVKSKPYPAKP